MMFQNHVYNSLTLTQWPDTGFVDMPVQVVSRKKNILNHFKVEKTT